MKTLIDNAEVVALFTGEESDCICCEGKHRFSSKLNDIHGNNIVSKDIIYDAYKNLPNGTKIKITMEILK